MDSVSIREEWGSRVGWLQTKVHEAAIPGTDRARISAAILGQALDHHHAIVFLLEHHLCGSAFSLLRSEFESYARGVWFQHCADDGQIRTFLDGRGTPGLDRILAAIQRAPGFEQGVLLEIKRNHWRTMSEYTHTGLLQVQRWQSQAGDAIEPSYEDAEIIEVLELADFFGYLSAIEMFQLAGDEIAINEVYGALLQRPDLVGRQSSPPPNE